MPATKPIAEPLPARWPLFDNGIAALAFGVVCLLAPVLLERDSRFSTIAMLLRIPGVLGLVLGLVLLLLHGTARRHPKHQELLSSAFGDADAIVPEAPADWTPAMLHALDAARLAAVCEALFTQAGFSAHRETPGGDSGSVDLWLYSKHAHGAAAIVRCAVAAAEPIGIDEVRLLQAARSAHALQRATYATNGTFDDEAIQFAREHAINALDGDRLLALIGTRTREQQQDLLAAVGAAA
jgi:restriction system protein